MKQYKVIGTIAICVPQRTKLKRGEVKPDSFFVDGQIAELIGRGMIAEIEEEKEPEETKVIDLKKLKLPELQSLCLEKGIEFSPEDNKPKLIELLTIPAA